ncbi:hypothetical protein E2C01_000088 [Portunus trituberculatus]|uniref:Uncharacterized protein n=1 Tax=Portunus trituberculatus TaxID=210409 RepID=A0A5B7CGD0_PORTR|nr:hypothetical protein [Portunus trituberculatus]
MAGGSESSGEYRPTLTTRQNQSHQLRRGWRKGAGGKEGKEGACQIVPCGEALGWVPLTLET